MKFLTVGDIAERWCVSKDVVYSYIAAGLLRATKFGRSWRVRPKDLEAFELQKMKMDQAELRDRRCVCI